jgi:hypothetical protein
MRTGFVIAAVLLIVAAILFAPRAGHDGPNESPPPPESAPAPAADDRPAGRVDLTILYAGLPDDDFLETLPNRAYRNLLEFRDHGRRWATPEEFEQATRWLIEARDHADRLHSDPRYRAEWRVRTNVRMAPLLRDHEFVVESRPPWLVFVEAGEGAEAEASRSADLLRRLSDEIHARFASRIGLPPVVDSSEEAERVLKVLVFRDREAFEDYYRKAGHPPPVFADCYYSDPSEGAVLYREPGASTAEWAETLLYPAALQAFDVLTRMAMRRETPKAEDLPWNDRRLDPAVIWLRTGLARALSSVRIDENGEVIVFARNRAWLATLKRSLDAGKDVWPLRRLLAVPNRDRMRQKALEMGLNPMEAGRLRRLFDIQSWALFSCLFEDARTRPKLVERIGRELRGLDRGQDDVRLAGSDFGALQAKYEAWLQAAFKAEGLK